VVVTDVSDFILLAEEVVLACEEEPEVTTDDATNAWVLQ